uniref:Uncharacterized protein n=1 Tax=Romanomermis culicivorax TaxID=13658 RepID=A0A915L1I6_ROMCU
MEEKCLTSFANQIRLKTQNFLGASRGANDHNTNYFNLPRRRSNYIRITPSFDKNGGLKYFCNNCTPNIDQLLILEQRLEEMQTRYKALSSEIGLAKALTDYRLQMMSSPNRWIRRV